MGVFKNSVLALGITLALAGPANGGVKKPENNLAGDGLKVAQTSDLTRLTITDILDK